MSFIDLCISYHGHQTAGMALHLSCFQNVAWCLQSSFEWLILVFAALFIRRRMAGNWFMKMCFVLQRKACCFLLCLVVAHRFSSCCFSLWVSPLNQEELVGFHCCRDFQLYVLGDERIKGWFFFLVFVKLIIKLTHVWEFKKDMSNYLNPSTIDELETWCLMKLVTRGSDQLDGIRYPWQPCEWPPPN